MKDALVSAEDLYKFIHTVCFSGVNQNLGGNHGLNGMMSGLREDLLKETGIICGYIKSGRVNQEAANKYLAICQTAQATGVLSETDLNKIASFIEGT